MPIDIRGPRVHCFDELPDAVQHIWAKSGDEGGYGLLPHILDIAAVAEQILRREPASTLAWAARAFGRSEDGLIRWLAWLMGQHDLGKATVGFQAKWPQGKLADEASGLSFPSRLLSADRHDLSSAVLLSARMNRQLAGAVAAHHGFHFEPRVVKNAKILGEPQAWIEARRVLIETYDQTLLPEVADVAADLDLSSLNWLAGLTSVADWIGSNTVWFPHRLRHETCEGHHACALQLADQALDQIGWPRQRPLLTETHADVADLIARMTGLAGIQPRPLQQAADELLKFCAAPALLIVEAPMGEGKTELAFLAHLRLQAQLGHRGLYIGLPTQATGNAMFQRALRFLHAFQDGMPLDLQLAHGGAALSDQVVELRQDHGALGRHEAVQCSEWFSQKRRALISPYGVGTIDQALYATLNVKHHFVRLWGLTNRVVVLDEVHAYDSYTGGLIEALLRWLKALGCSVILMSATLPASRRRALLSAWDVDEHALPALPYPRVVMASDGRVDGRHCVSRALAPIDLCGIDESMDSIVERVLVELAGDGCIAVIVNTVDRAQQLYTTLRPQVISGVPVLLFHARFPAEERGQHEREVMRLFGKTGERPKRALLIATQVAEQSLDIDFDLLISDLAPVDLLLQRAGRLHRHERVRPSAHQRPRLVVAGLTRGALPELKQTGWASVYDPYLLGRTWAFASREQQWTLPQDIDRLVQLVYDDETDLPADIDGTSRAYIEGEALGEHLAQVQQMSQFAANAAIDAHAEPQNAYVGKPHGREAGEGLGEDNRTRFGAESLTLIPVHVDGGLWRLFPDEPSFDPTLKPGAELSRRLLTRQVKLSRKAVVKALQGSEIPAGWRAHPWLSDLRVLPLTEGCWRHGSLCVRLDERIGIVYTSG
ncbi:CRISPR-associated helicase Cas3' [Sphaerotilus mobilis]|uniref:CRISPR-associated Cas3 family helicase n=1 Tax=Sphaerotilus mobilis TaxID=47994 RepID=A0A4Q7LG07_9BURK|nr:CRISPR-associated helicase Cas3' [Sphaerotilus mobilis]RZS52992.1 CRISPR-associated Cas3 family helicase [Sphaerotilus mobilis]